MARVKKDETAKFDLSALNAAKAYEVLAKIPVGEKTLFDLIFDLNKSENPAEKVSKEDREEYVDLSVKLSKSTGEERESVAKEIMIKFPEALRKSNILDIEIKKALILHQEQTNELSELFTGVKTPYLKEAIGNALSYIMFLASV